MIDITTEQVISLADAAERLCVHIRTVRAYVSRQTLESARAGGRRITSLEALQRFLRQDTPAERIESPRQLSAESLAQHNLARKGLAERHGLRA